ncbi:unnamed protein product [Meloidogyne enterolobii]|uniref:Uncharacterized protein n=1 Tax=Meloidogyne enterolobii TaxID=390850 RepID=A0ACB1ASF5_MELEN
MVGGMTPSEHSKSSWASEINKDKINCFNLGQTEQLLKRHKSLNLLYSETFKNQNKTIWRSNSLGSQRTDLSNYLPIYAQIKHSRQSVASQKLVSSEDCLLDRK